ncbi:cell surface glycoprotein CD200 receptor 1 isoform X2 [Syngnathoides biaculeatus]|uniref:cell surface glycoprotein CD200 receptor 1 isoform X2 n=1 Tax=Syngnathoides biaculeatus TaxID=300417 RepID=UPI002ADDF65D|nr:cell surface glycoprotein CD200 receptor 1 isoform X2 [Syngnathoides biaculeatus]
MRNPTGVFAVILSLLCRAWTQDSVVYLSFNVGSEVELNCGNASWSKVMYIIWKMDLVGQKPCKVGRSSQVPGTPADICANGKALRNASEDRYYLHVPNFSERDVGLYKCEVVFQGGSRTCNISVSITVPPRISSWLERRDDDSTVAVCKAEGGKPAAAVAWRHAGNSSSVETRRSAGGFFSVESNLKLPEGAGNAGNLTCVVKHPFWQGEKTLVPKFRKGFPYTTVLILIIFTVLVVFGTLFLLRKKKIMLSCPLADSSPSVSEPKEEVEEVEPYASYVQRVNSIYDS